MADNPLRVCIIDAAIGDDAMTNLFDEIRELEAKYNKPLSPFWSSENKRPRAIETAEENWTPARS